MVHLNKLSPNNLPHYITGVIAHQCLATLNVTTDLNEYSAEDVTDSVLDTLCVRAAHILQDGVQEIEARHLVSTLFLPKLEKHH